MGLDRGIKMGIPLIVGGGGFIGHSLIKVLLDSNNLVAVIDNWSRGSKDNLTSILDIYGDRLIVRSCDASSINDTYDILSALHDQHHISEVWHLAANSDISAGVMDCSVDLKDTFMTTYSLLQAMRLLKIPTLNFASSSAVYGDMGELQITESSGPLLPISNYGAMKLASEALISAAVESYLNRANIFRFPNVVGVPATHGVIYDFISRMKIEAECLNVKGDGTQKKAYLHVSDLVSAMMLLSDQAINSNLRLTLTNIGPIDDGVTVRWIAERVVERINPHAKIIFGRGNRGWVGDVPKFRYSTELIRSYGWNPSLSSEEAIILAIDQIATQLYI